VGEGVEGVSRALRVSAKAEAQGPSRMRARSPGLDSAGDVLRIIGIYTASPVAWFRKVAAICAMKANMLQKVATERSVSRCGFPKVGTVKQVDQDSFLKSVTIQCRKKHALRKPAATTLIETHALQEPATIQQ
jgi:hypothetical protein